MKGMTQSSVIEEFQYIQYELSWKNCRHVRNTEHLSP